MREEVTFRWVYKVEVENQTLGFIYVHTLSSQIRTNLLAPMKKDS